jgi:hypothetical protein
MNSLSKKRARSVRWGVGVRSRSIKNAVAAAETPTPTRQGQSEVNSAVPQKQFRACEIAVLRIV